MATIAEVAIVAVATFADIAIGKISNSEEIGSNFSAVFCLAILSISGVMLAEANFPKTQN